MYCIDYLLELITATLYAISGIRPSFSFYHFIEKRIWIKESDGMRFLLQQAFQIYYL